MTEDTVGSLFNIAPVQFQTEISNISCLDVSNDILTISFKNNAQISRIDLSTPETIHTLELPFKKNYQEVGYVERLFQDPTGEHLIATTSRRETFYKNSQSTQFKHLTELKNLEITTISWNDKAVTSLNTGNFLLGDRSGGIHEAFLEYQPSTKKYFKAIAKNIYNTGTSIDGISLRFDQKENKFTIVLASADEICYWNGMIKLNKPIKYNELYLKHIFTMAPVECEKYESIKSSSSSAYDSCKFSSSQEKIGWLIDLGIVFGDITQANVIMKRNLGDLKFLVKAELPESEDIFQSIIFTRYHLVLLRGSEILVINTFNDELVFRQLLPLAEDERFIGLSSDELKNTYWVYSNKNIYEITVEDEDQYIWKSMVENHLYDEALNVTKDLESRDIIYNRKAEYLFQRGEMNESAKVFALTSSPSFEAISLKFLELNEIDALQTYFLSKFTILKTNKILKFHVPLTLLSCWIVENYIVKLNELDEQLENQEIRDVEELGQWTSFKLEISQDLQTFITSNVEVLDQKTIYEIIIANNRTDELIYFANLIKDYDFVVTYWIRLEKYNEVLDTLCKINDVEIVYKYATVLLLNVPNKTIETWLSIPGLDPSRLIPALLKYNEINKKIALDNHQGIKFLSKFIKENKVENSNIHDTLLYFLISNGNDETLVLRYLEESKDSAYYNADFILRLCLRFNKVRAAIMIYCKLKFYEDAINLALSNELVNEAIIIADKVEDAKTRKFLYLKISKLKIDKIQPSQSMEIQQEVKFLLERCDLLTIKDLLPILPDFTTIDNFKEQICQDLEKFGNTINKLNQEMETNVQINHDIVQDIQTKIVNRSMIIRLGSSCSSCEKLLISRKFFTFHCQHSFHSDCLIKIIMASNDFKTKKSLEFLQKNYLTKQNNNVKFINHPQVDSLLSEKCPLCSDLRIDLIDTPLIENLNLQDPDDW